MSLVALVPDRLFDGEAFRTGVAVLLEGGWIVDVVARSRIPTAADVEIVEGLLAPGFVDVQVNGGGGVLLNDEPTVEGIRAIARAHRRFGTTGLLPTLITDTHAKMAAAIRAIQAALKAGAPGVLGVHIEGPFLNPARKGVHDPRLMRAPDEADLAVLTEGGAGVVVVTLAPERVASEAVARLTAAGVRVAAGHTAATAAELDAARGAGLSGYTHLFNAMPPLQGREPGPVGSALSERETFCGLIADMHHVSAQALRAAILAKGRDRAMLVTDAMPTVGTDLAAFELQGRNVFRGGGRLTTEDGTLAGSDLDMATAVRNTVDVLSVPLEDALVMASRTPATWLGLDRELGRVAAGFRADLVQLDGGVNVCSTWIAGQREHA